MGGKQGKVGLKYVTGCDGGLWIVASCPGWIVGCVGFVGRKSGGCWSFNLEMRDEMLGFSGEKTRIGDGFQAGTGRSRVCALDLPLFFWGGQGAGPLSTEGHEGLRRSEKFSLGEVPGDDEANRILCTV